MNISKNFVKSSILTMHQQRKTQSNLNSTPAVRSFATEQKLTFIITLCTYNQLSPDKKTPHLGRAQNGKSYVLNQNKIFRKTVQKFLPSERDFVAFRLPANLATRVLFSCPRFLAEEQQRAKSFLHFPNSCFKEK